MLNYVCNEHEIIRFSEDGSCLRLADVEGIDFIGPPDNRDPFNREAPKYLGLSRSEEGLKAHYYIGTSWLKEGHISVSVLPKLNTQTCRINFAAMLGAALEIDEIRNALSRLLPPHEIPAQWEWVDSIPRTSSGKIQRLKLKS